MLSIVENFDNIDTDSLLCKLVKEKDNVDFEMVNKEAKLINIIIFYI